MPRHASSFTSTRFNRASASTSMATGDNIPATPSASSDQFATAEPFAPDLYGAAAAAAATPPARHSATSTAAAAASKTAASASPARTVSRRATVPLPSLPPHTHVQTSQPHLDPTAGLVGPVLAAAHAPSSFTQHAANTTTTTSNSNRQAPVAGGRGTLHLLDLESISSPRSPPPSPAVALSSPGHPHGLHASEQYHDMHHATMATGFSGSISPSASQQQHPKQEAEPDQAQPQLETEQSPGQTSDDASPTMTTAAPSDSRTLPSRDVTEANIDTAYSQFILYCNPAIPLDVDTEELKKGFRNPPRSDGNSFSPWNLYHLLQKLDRKEIKTWAHLVMELGVEPPDREKNQSAQKVQQYAVRLKRWLHAYHIDAFFSYLDDKPTPYYTERPTTDADLAETIREGVPPEEDLAVRALLPEWRPKRGRRKAEEMADSEAAPDTAPNPSKRQRASIAGYPTTTTTTTTTATIDEYSATPIHTTPWSAVGSGPQGDVWTAARAAIAPKTPSPQPEAQGQLQTPRPDGASAGPRLWRRAITDTNTPATPHPHSAMTPRVAFSQSPGPGFTEEEPKTALPGKSSRTRKRHSPAISSAWNQGGTANGKIRGRPPSNRNVQDGPFGTFPVNPASGAPVAPPTGSQAEESGGNTTSPPYRATDISPPRKPSKLQLQVPQTQDRNPPIRLPTPPRVIINGDQQQQPQQAPLHPPPPPPDTSHPVKHHHRSSQDITAYHRRRVSSSATSNASIGAPGTTGTTTATLTALFNQFLEELSETDRSALLQEDWADTNPPLGFGDPAHASASASAAPPLSSASAAAATTTRDAQVAPQTASTATPATALTTGSESSASISALLNQVSTHAEENTPATAGPLTGSSGNASALSAGLGGMVDWRKRCFILLRRLQDKEEELRRVRRAVLDAVM